MRKICEQKNKTLKIINHMPFVYIQKNYSYTTEDL